MATEALFAVRTVVSLGIEDQFEKRYNSSLGGARKATVRNMTAFGVSVGMALSAYLIMMAVAIIYGAFTLAGEMDKSEFPVKVEGIPGVINMTCQTADAYSRTEGFLNVTNREPIDVTNETSFREYLTTEAPDKYLDDNSQYYACATKATNVLLAILLIMSAGEGFSMAGTPAAVMSEARYAAARVLEIINRAPAIDSFSEDGLKPHTCGGEIEVRDVVYARHNHIITASHSYTCTCGACRLRILYIITVSCMCVQVRDVVFAYPTAADHLVANGFSLSIPAGKTMALCGASGSGKSTLIQLLERFYDPQSGVITLDGHDIKTLNVRWLRGQLGLVGQEPVLFQGTVAQNIAYGKQTAATQEEIEAAAKKANAHGFITENLQNGYETEVGLQGGRLSGGQKQRVAIARALIKKPAVLLLDEATSALDNQSETVVQAALDGVMAAGGLTTVVIAHRLSTIRNADCIAVVNEGKVVEKGTHEELLGEQGLYASLVLSHS